MFQEAFERVTKELTASAASAMKINVVSPPDDIVLTGDAKTLPLCGSVSTFTVSPDACDVSVARRRGVVR